MTLLSATPVLPVADVARAVDYYVTRLGFEAVTADATAGVVARDRVRIELRADPPGADPELAGSASCRVFVADSDRLRALHAEMAGRELVHPVGEVRDRPWGAEFAVLDLDRNAISFTPYRSVAGD